MGNEGQFAPAGVINKSIFIRALFCLAAIFAVSAQEADAQGRADTGAKPAPQTPFDILSKLLGGKKQESGGKTTTLPDGSVVTEYADKSRKTVFPDGKVVVEFPGGHKQTRYPDGKIVTELPDGGTKTVYPDGKTVEVFAGGLKQTEYPDGKGVTGFPDGSKQTKHPDGKHITEFPDGGTATVYPGGKKVKIFANGQTQTTFPDGKEETVFPDGARIIQHADGKTVQIFADGQKQTVFPDGREVTEFPGGQKQTAYPDGRKEAVFPDGGKMTEYADGSKVKVFASGLTQSVHPNGRVVTLYADGRRKTRHPNGKTVVEPASKVFALKPGQGGCPASAATKAAGSGSPEGGADSNHDYSGLSSLDNRLFTGATFASVTPVGEIKKLLAQGANPNFSRYDNGETSVHRAAGNSSPEIMHVLVACGGDCSIRDGYGQTPLHHASKNASIYAPLIVKLALKCKGADPNAVDGQGLTPLMLAAGGPYEGAGVIRLLLKAGAKPDKRAPNGNAALHFAALKSGDEPAKFNALLKGGADPDAVNKQGSTALHLLADNADDDYGKAVSALLGGGADPCIKDGIAARRPVSYANENGHVRMSNALYRADGSDLACDGKAEREAVAEGDDAADGKAVAEDVAPEESGSSQEPVETASQAAPALAVGTVFQDCPGCPQMVVVPSGSFMMGSSPSEEGRDDDEGPVHQVNIGYSFAVGVHEVTFAEWDACTAGGGCNGYSPHDRGWGRGNRPAINVSWEDAQSYLKWLSGKTGKSYRLLSESEWEYVARAGTTTPFHYGSTISTEQANYDGNFTYGSGAKGAYRKKTVPVGSFPPNAFGLHDVHGNVWEWTHDCWNDNYQGAPNDGSAWQSGDCSRRVLRGGSWYYEPRDLRSANRIRYTVGTRFDYNGYRVARTLTP